MKNSKENGRQASGRRVCASTGMRLPESADAASHNSLDATSAANSGVYIKIHLSCCQKRCHDFLSIECSSPLQTVPVMAAVIADAAIMHALGKIDLDGPSGGKHMCKRIDEIADAIQSKLNNTKEDDEDDEDNEMLEIL